MGCHEAKFSRYERVATDLGIPEEIMMEQLVFSDQAIGDLMEIALRPGDAQQFFGVMPPDLTLVARARNPAWLYRSEEHTSELQSRGHLVCRLLLEKKQKDIEQE